jgi:hypothetical protein
MRKPGTLDAFDKTGVVVVTILGTGLGLLIAVASDIPFKPRVIVMFPGLAVGCVACKLFGLTAGIVVTALANGTIYGLLLYAWDRLCNKLASVLRKMSPAQR